MVYIGHPLILNSSATSSRSFSSSPAILLSLSFGYPTMMRPTTRSSRSSRPVPIKIHCDNSEPVTADDSTDTPGTNTAKKHEKPEKGEKGKKPRHRMTNRQLEHLEALYQKATHPSRQDKEELGKKVGM